MWREVRVRGLASADVPDRGGHQDAVGALERAEHDLDRELGAVLAQGDELDAGPDLLGQRIGRRAQVVGDQPLGEALRDDVGDLLPDQLVALIAELLLGLEIEQDDVAGLVDHDHRVGGGLQQSAVASFGFTSGSAPHPGHGSPGGERAGIGVAMTHPDVDPDAQRRSRGRSDRGPSDSSLMYRTIATVRPSSIG